MNIHASKQSSDTRTLKNKTELHRIVKVRTVYWSSLCTGPHFKRSLPTAGAHFVHWEYIYIYIYIGVPIL
jgi:hypothetical protein